MPLSHRVDALRRVPLFSDLSRRELDELASIGTETDYSPGTELTRQGAAGRDFLVLLEGQVSIIQDGEKIAQRSAGDFFGEIALISHGPRTATIVADTFVRVLSINDRTFRALLGRMPGVQAGVFKVLAERVLPA